MRATLLLLWLTLANAYLYDIFFTDYKSTCSGGCDAWSKHPDYFLHGKVPADAGSQCALVSGHADKGTPHGDGHVENSFLWPWCFCKGKATECKPPQKTVEQLNLQIASKDVIVASFLTYESVSGKPSAMLGKSKDSMQEVTGESHAFNSFSKGTSHSAYAMHYVPFRSLEARQTYFYKVKSGTGSWSETYSFRMPGPSGETKLAIFGDMGVDKHNNMGNLKDDYESGAIDAILHMGDHSYDLQRNNDRTGDGYMNYFQPVLQQCPWFPIVGNHESREMKRFEAMAEGFVIGQKKSTLLGQHLSLGNQLGAAAHSSVPSGSPKYMSTDIGLVHVIGIDTGSDSSTTLKNWVEKDLEAAHANRDNVPWIVVINHYPGYVEGSSDDDMEHASLEAYLSLEGEDNTTMRYRTCAAMGHNSSTCETVGSWRTKVQDGLEPLYKKYGVDIVGGGHHHFYQATWPMYQSKSCQKNFDKPSCPVYFTEGNGGVPDRCSASCRPASFKNEWVRTSYKQCGAYGRITASKTSLRYDHVVNDDTKVIDSWTITKGSAPPAPPAPTPSPTPPAPTPPTPAPKPAPTPAPAPTPGPKPAPTPAPGPTPGASDTLPAKGTLDPGDQLVSKSGSSRLTRQSSDGDLVFYEGGKKKWSSKTSGNPGAYLIFQSSGPKLVIRGDTTKPLWSSKKVAGATKLVAKDDDLVFTDDTGKKIESLLHMISSAEEITI